LFFFLILNLNYLFYLFILLKISLLFGSSQFYVFVIPSKAKPNDPYYTFETMQDEIAQASGLLNSDNKVNMTQGELLRGFLFSVLKI